MAGLTVSENKGDGCMDLPPGFRFHPTDQEIIIHYLLAKVLNPHFTSVAIIEANLNKCEPWDLPSKAKIGELEWYFFFQGDRKYPTGMRTNRTTESSFWKATGKDKEIFKEAIVLVGMKKTLVFYLGRATSGQKTNWVMHEFRLAGTPHSHHLSESTMGSWVVCRVVCKNLNNEKNSTNEVTSKGSSDNEMVIETSSLIEEGLDDKENFTQIGMMDQVNPSTVLTETSFTASAAVTVAPSDHVGVPWNVKQLSNQPMLSPEINTEISAVIPKNEGNNLPTWEYVDGSYEEFGSIWNYCRA